MRKTKIICTLGPASENEDILKKLMTSGMDVARFNFSHSTHEDHKKRYDQVDKLRKELNLPIATLLDTRGPEIRTGLMKNDKVELKEGDKLILTTEECLGTKEKISINYMDLPKDISDGDRILIDDGLIELKVLSHTSTDITCNIINGGVVSNRKGINVPGIKLSMPYLSEKDISDLKFGVKTGFDFVAASFTRSADDIDEVRAVLNEAGNNTIRIIAKIENADGVDNIDEILKVADGIMVARGDMGVEIPFEEIPVLQKVIIKKGYNAGKQVITATQMLDSMMKNPRPTRAEATDIANAIYDGTSAIMLSGETAAGLYPVEALKTMVKLAEKTESDIDYEKRFRTRDTDDAPNITNAISHATVTTSIDLHATAIVTVTKTGQTARMISKYRPEAPIISGTTSETVCRQMNLSWGVIPMMVEEKTDSEKLFEHAVDCAEKNGYVKDGDLVVITGGMPLGVSGTTNMMKVHVVGDILVTGIGITRGSIKAPLCVCSTIEQAKKNFTPGDIIVIEKTTNEIMELLKDCSGIITEADGLNSHAATVGLTLDKPVIIGAKNATQILRSGNLVTLDSEKGIVCSTANI